MPQGTCRLCNAFADLQLSHVLPAFAFRWLRETSGTGHIRLGKEPNLRAQDGLKLNWLCVACEGLLSKSETAFATNIFHPYSKGGRDRFTYSRWLMLFCVSVSWRVLSYYREETSLTDYSGELLARIAEADRIWKDVLLGQRPHPGAFQQHLLPLDAIKSATGELPPNINRYLMRAIDMDLIRGGNTCFVFSKLGRFIILGFIKDDHPNHWRGTKVLAKEGFLEPRKYVVPRQFADYLSSKARRMAELIGSVSDRQQEKIDEAFWKNIGKVAESDAFKAMENDVRLFGSAAFSERRAPKADER